MQPQKDPPTPAAFADWCVPEVIHSENPHVFPNEQSVRWAILTCPPQTLPRGT